MYPLIRFAREVMAARRAPRLPPMGAHVSTHRVWPWDLDPWWELNNGRTLTLYDLGRIPMAIRLGITETLRRRGIDAAASGQRMTGRECENEILTIDGNFDDAGHVDGESEQRDVERRRPLGVHRRRAAGEHQRGRVFLAHLSGGDGGRDDLGVNASLAHAAGDELGVLGTEVDDEDRVLESTSLPDAIQQAVDLAEAEGDLDSRPLLNWFIEEQIENPDFGRIAAQTAKQVDAALQGFGVAISDLALIDEDVAARRLVRPFETVLKTGWRYYFVYPDSVAHQQKLNLVRDWIAAHWEE